MHGIDVVASNVENHGLDKACINILKRPNKTKINYYEFLQAREKVFVKELNTWGFVKPVNGEHAASDDEIDED